MSRGSDSRLTGDVCPACICVMVWGRLPGTKLKTVGGAPLRINSIQKEQTAVSE